MVKIPRDGWKCVMIWYRTIVYIPRFGLQYCKVYLWICEPSEDLDQPAYLHSLIRIFTECILDNQICKDSSCWQRRLSRLHRWAGWFQSLLGAHVRRYIFLRCGLFIFVYQYFLPMCNIKMVSWLFFTRLFTLTFYSVTLEQQIFLTLSTLWINSAYFSRK